MHNNRCKLKAAELNIRHLCMIYILHVIVLVVTRVFTERSETQVFTRWLFCKRSGLILP